MVKTCKNHGFRWLFSPEKPIHWAHRKSREFSHWMCPNRCINWLGKNTSLQKQSNIFEMIPILNDISTIFPWYFHILKVFFSSYIYDRLASAFPKVDTDALHWWISLAMQTSFFARKIMFLAYPITNPKYHLWEHYRSCFFNSLVWKRFWFLGGVTILFMGWN